MAPAAQTLALSVAVGSSTLQGGGVLLLITIAIH